MQKTPLNSILIDTPIGKMLAISNPDKLLLLEFTDKPNLEREIEKLIAKTKSVIMPGETNVTRLIKSEITNYFEGTLKEFKTPIHPMGSPFQNNVWQELTRIPYGQTRSYAELANSIGNKKAYRAVAKANSTNQLAIIIPCHRVIGSNGGLGGYAGGIERKKWLIAHEALSIAP